MNVIVQLEKGRDVSSLHNLKKVIKDFQDILDKVPTEHRDAVSIYFYPSEEYGDTYVRYDIYFSRPETDEEQNARQKQNKLRIAETKRLELKQLKKLKDKYPDT